MIPNIPSAPLNVEWELTFRCNQKCLFCFNAGQSPGNELHINGVRRIVDELERNNVFTVTLSGGEPFLYPDIELLVDYLSKKNLRINMLSNGTMIPENLIRVFSLHKKFTVQLSVEGLMDTHDTIVGLKGSFDKVVETMNMMGEYKAHFLCVTTLMSMNYRELPRMYDYFSEKGVRSWRVITLIPYGNALVHDLSLSLPEYRWAYTRLCEKLEQSPGINVEIRCPTGLPFTNLPLKEDERTQWVGCCGAVSYLQITPSGDVYPCCLLRGEKFLCGNLVETPLAEIWRAPAMQFLRDNYYNFTGKCTYCAYAHVCRGGCKVLSHAMYGDFRKPDPRCLYDPSTGLTLPEYFQEKRKMKGGDKNEGV